MPYAGLPLGTSSPPCAGYERLLEEACLGGRAFLAAAGAPAAIRNWLPAGFDADGGISMEAGPSAILSGCGSGRPLLRLGGPGAAGGVHANRPEGGGVSPKWGEKKSPFWGIALSGALERV